MYINVVGSSPCASLDRNVSRKRKLDISSVEEEPGEVPNKRGKEQYLHPPQPHTTPSDTNTNDTETTTTNPTSVSNTVEADTEMVEKGKFLFL